MNHRQTFTDDVIILDRDGTIVVDRGYLANPEQLEFLRGAPEALRWLCECGFRLVVITNQSGVGRGLFSLAQVEAVHERLRAMLVQVRVAVTAIYFCPHAPAESCQCRKPNLALMERAAKELNFEPRRSVVIGDKDSDVQFGRRAGAKTIRISDENGSSRTAADLTVATLIEAARAIACSQLHNK